MSRRSLIAVLATMAVVAGSMSVGMASAQESPAGDSGKVTFTLGTVADMVSANPFKACCGSEYEMMFLAYDMLFNFSQPTMEATSALAEFPPTESGDGKTWTFKIRDDVKWSDGVPLTAHDIAFTYNFINEKHLASFNDYLGYPLEKDAFEAPDDTTLIWHMAKPTLSPLTPPWIPIVPEHVWSKYMADKYTAKDIKEFRNVPAVGSGPFVLTEWQEGRFWRMEANKDYWMGAPHIDEVIFRIYDSPEALKLALVNGEIDAADALPPSIFNSLQDQPNITTNLPPAGYFDNLAFNFEGTANPALRDEDVRMAIAYSIDRQALVDRVLLGYGSVGTSVVLPVYAKHHWEPSADEVIGYDPEKAKLMLDQAGYTDTDGDGVREDKNGDPLEMEVLTIADVTYSVPEGKLIAGWLNDVGIKAKVKTVSEGKAYDLWGAQDFDMYVWGWGGDPDPDFILSIFTTHQCLSWSDGCYKDPAFDQMYEAQQAETDPVQRTELITKMQQYLYEKNPEIVLLYEADLQAYRNDRFTGFVKQPDAQGFIFYGFGPYSYINITPANQAGGGTGTQAAQESSGGGMSAGVWIGILVAVLVLLGVVILVRRSKGSQDTE